MRNEPLVNNKPIKFIRECAFLAMKVFFAFLSGWALFFILSDDNRKSYILNHTLLSILLILGMVILAVVQSWYYSNIYIYEVNVDDSLIEIKWQDRTKFKEVRTAVKNVKAMLKPSGKDTPYLQIIINENTPPIVLNQTTYPGWSRSDMERFIKVLSEIPAPI